MALTSTRMGERRMVGGRERQFEREARKVGGQFGQSLREEAAMMRLDRGSNIGSADDNIKDDRLRNTMTESMIQQGRNARGVDTPSTGGIAPPSTPGLDRLAAMQPGAQSQGQQGAPESFAQTEARKRRESAASGAFGRGAQMREEARSAQEGNLRERQSLFNQMAQAENPEQLKSFRGKARALGVDEEGWGHAMTRLEQLGMDISGPEEAPADVTPPTRRATAGDVVSAVDSVFPRSGATGSTDRVIPPRSERAAPVAPETSDEDTETTPTPIVRASAVDPPPDLDPRPVEPVVNRGDLPREPDAPRPQDTLSEAFGDRAFIDPAVERRRKRESARARVAAANERARTSRRSKSTGPFARDSVAGRITQWLQADNL